MNPAASHNVEQERLVEFARAVRESTLERLWAVPPGYENWKVSPKAMSFADIAQHLIDTDNWLFQKLNDPLLKPILGQAGSFQVADRQHYTALLEVLARSGQRREQVLTQMTPESLEEPIHDERFGGEVSRWWIVVRGNFDHEIHHRGQIATYLRVINDGEVGAEGDWPG